MPTMSRLKFPHIEEPELRVKVQRYFMAVFCFLYMILGFGLIASGAVLISRQQTECHFMAQYYSGVCLLLAAGCFTAFFSFCGCLKTRQNNAPHYYTSFLMVLIVIIFMEITAAVTSHVLYVKATGGQLKQEMTDARDNFWTSSKSAECINKIQSHFHCCGVSNYSEWITLFDNSSAHDVFPSSCMCDSDSAETQGVFCVEETVHAGNVSLSLNVSRQSCYSIFVDDLYEKQLITQIVSPIFAVLKLIFLFMVLFLIHHVHNRSLVSAYVVKQSNMEPPAVLISEAVSLGEANDLRWAEMQDQPKNADKNFKAVQKPRMSVSISRDENVHL